MPKEEELLPKIITLSYKELVVDQPIDSLEQDHQTIANSSVTHSNTIFLKHNNM
jgi:hypothetical protein